MTTRNLLASGRRESIRQSAHVLADSGFYAQWQHIVAALSTRYGMIETRRLFVNRASCNQVNERYVKACDKRQNGRG
ncbi:hypothetical protein LJ656_30105 [Paraburkholderia sp. MMS20-SJTR3]|uniref:Uncharacterized protein n=1 Tax=Paraburkholderia sejongensis TaxID=2886946 RepID=A0ABS8K3V5_9BURK|nr:hypothetical protein [Paraburkholderia sp. MMS20-SJTR3]MCC8396845.1 hypothetical protein [Paraburkholderia sp. MMS20-SJTR3]